MFDSFPESELNLDEYLDWGEIDIHDPRIDTNLKKLQEDERILLRALKNFEPGKSILPYEEQELWKQRIEECLFETKLLIDLSHKAISIRNLLG